MVEECVSHEVSIGWQKGKNYRKMPASVKYDTRGSHRFLTDSIVILFVGIFINDLSRLVSFYQLHGNSSSSSIFLR